MTKAIKINDLNDGLMPYLGSEQEKELVGNLLTSMDTADGNQDGFINDPVRARQVFERASLRFPSQLGNWEAIKTILLSRLPEQQRSCGDAFVQGIRDFRREYRAERHFQPFRPTDEFGKSLLPWLDFYKRNGLEKTTENLTKMPVQERERLVMDLMRSSIEIRIPLHHDHFENLRFFTSRLLVSENNAINGKTYDQIRAMISSGLEVLRSRARTDNLGELRINDRCDFLKRPETLALLFEGIHYGQYKNILPKSIGSLVSRACNQRTNQIHFFDGQEMRSIPVVHEDESHVLSPEALKAVKDTFELMAKLLPPETEWPEEIILKNRSSTAMHLQNGSSRLIISTRTNYDIATFAQALVHEFAHYYHNLITNHGLRSSEFETVVTGWFDRENRLDVDMQAFLRMAKTNDGGLFFAESMNDTDNANLGHPWDNKDEFFASSFTAFTLYADNLVKKFNNPHINPATKEYAKKVWIYMRDEIFMGNVFTSDGLDPFAGET